MDLQPQNQPEAAGTTLRGLQNSTFLLLLILYSFLSQGIAHAQVNVHAIYDTGVKAAHKNSKKVWSDEESLKQQQAIINDYEKNPINYLGRDILAPAFAYGYCGKLEEAVVLMKRYLIDHPDEDPILYLLGVTQLGLGNNPDAIKNLQKAWGLGFQKAAKWLVLANIGGGHMEVCEKLIPSLLKEKNNDPQAVDALVAYCLELMPFKTNIFLRAVDGMTDEDMLKRPDAHVGLYLRGLWIAKQDGRARAIVAKADEQNRDVINGLFLNAGWRKQIIANYETDSMAWKDNELLIAAIAYASDAQYGKAKPLYISFLKVRPDQKRALRGLAIILFSEHNFEEAKELWKKAWALGDVESLKSYAFVCVQTKNHDELGTLVPDLLKHKSEDSEMIGLIMEYAADQNPPDKQLFQKAIEGVSDATVLQNANVTRSFILGLRRFGEIERARDLQERASKMTTI